LAADAILHGARLKHEGNNLGYWTDANDWAEWQCELTKPGQFKVTAELASTSTAAFDIIVGKLQLRVTFPSTGNYTKYQTIEAGTLELAQPGKITLSVKPVKAGWKPVNLKSLKLSPN
jgi:hypothetical protein